MHLVDFSFVKYIGIKNATKKSFFKWRFFNVKQLTLYMHVIII